MEIPEQGWTSIFGALYCVYNTQYGYLSDFPYCCSPCEDVGSTQTAGQACPCLKFNSRSSHHIWAVTVSLLADKSLMLSPSGSSQFHLRYVYEFRLLSASRFSNDGHEIFSTYRDKVLPFHWALVKLFNQARNAMSIFIVECSTVMLQFGRPCYILEMQIVSCRIYSLAITCEFPPFLCNQFRDAISPLCMSGVARFRRISKWKSTLEVNWSKNLASLSRSGSGSST